VNGVLSAIANWADQVKNQKAYKWSQPLHFINTPDWLCEYDRTRDCVDSGTKNFCVDGAIQNYTGRVVNTNLPFAQQAEALKFLVHFVGDIHQPLHVGFTTDKGGNTFTGTFEGESVNLHEIWDVNIIVKRMDDDFGSNQTAYTEYLWQQIQGPWQNQAAQWADCQTPIPSNACSIEWAEESIGAACDYAYVEADGKTHIATGFNLGDDYYNRNLPVVEVQLAKAGVRMAHVLNTLFSTATKRHARRH